MDFFPIIPLFIYLAVIIGFFYALYNISKNSSHQTQILHEILKELRSQRKDRQEGNADQL